MAWNDLIEPGIEEDEDQPEPEPEQHTTFPTACPSDSSPPPASPPVSGTTPGPSLPTTPRLAPTPPLTFPPNKIDLILISDCTYNPTFYQPLAQTISSLLAISGGSCVLGKKHRHEDEMGLWDVLRKAGLGARLVNGWEHEEEEGEERGGSGRSLPPKQ